MLFDSAEKLWWRLWRSNDYCNSIGDCNAFCDLFVFFSWLMDITRMSLMMSIVTIQLWSHSLNPFTRFLFLAFTRPLIDVVKFRRFHHGSMFRWTAVNRICSTGSPLRSQCLLPPSVVPEPWLRIRPWGMSFKIRVQVCRGKAAVPSTQMTIEFDN